ncbi:Oncoid [Papillomaviridae sp. Haddock_c6033]|nr:Oncoid [Papillomaviridae sp. Haddock_c6033]
MRKKQTFVTMSLYSDDDCDSDVEMDVDVDLYCSEDSFDLSSDEDVEDEHALAVDLILTFNGDLFHEIYAGIRLIDLLMFLDLPF